MKRKEGKKLFNFGFEIEQVEKWKKKAEKENRSLTNLIETVMNKYCEK